MKKIAYSILSTLLLGICIGFSACSLEPEYSEGLETEVAITNPSDAQTALNGVYTRLGNYRIGGRNAIAVGDIATDIIFDMNRTVHLLTIWNYNIAVTDPYLSEIWEYGYKVIDNSSRLIEACEKLIPEAIGSDKEKYDEILAQAYGLRALSQFYLVNLFALPIKVNGTINNGNTPGIVADGKVHNPGDKVSRNTVAETYLQINEDLSSAKKHYGAMKNASSINQYYMNLAAIYALQARVALQEEDFVTASLAADLAIAERNGQIITNSVKDYEAMFKNITINSEDIFTISKLMTDNNSSYSIGTLYSNYGFSPNSKLIDIYFNPETIIIKDDDDEDMEIKVCDDIRYPLLVDGGTETRDYLGGKYYGIPEDKAVGNIPVLRLPELYLIKAECYARSEAGTLDEIKTALLEVARRNPSIKEAKDLPNTKPELLEFIKAERVRELWMEGHRFSDLRRWGTIVNLRDFKPFDIAKFCYPIPAQEINSGAGVVQTPNWSAALPVR